jgi:hypothetical protein
MHMLHKEVVSTHLDLRRIINNTLDWNETQLNAFRSAIGIDTFHWETLELISDEAVEVVCYQTT